jgi:hypothetical protein
VNPGIRRTNLLVGLLLGGALLFLSFYLAGPAVGAVLAALLLYEGYTLVDSYGENTISESIWRMARRPLVPWVFGLGTGWAITAGVLNEPWLILTAGLLNGHFYWQRQRSYEVD